MEIPRKHDNKNNPNKTLPLAIKIGPGAGAGAGKFVIGGIVLFGGVLVTATIVSALVLKKRSQRRSTSENIQKSVDDPNKDSFVGCLPLEVEIMSDEVASMKEIEDENNQSLTPDENHNHEQAGDRNEDMINSVVVEDQENTFIHVDSAFKSEEFDNICEKIDLESDEQVVMAAQIENDSCLETNDGSEEQKQLILIDDELCEHIDTNSLVSEVSKNEDEDHQETDLLDETATAMEAGYVNRVKENEMNGHDEAGYADYIGKEVVMEKEATDATRLIQTEVTKEEEVIKSDCVNLVNTEDIFKTNSYKVAPDAEKMYQDCETFVVAYVMNRLKEAVDDQTITTKVDVPQNKETELKVKEQLMITEHELVKKDEIPQVQSVKKDANSEEYTFNMAADHEAAPETHQVCETLVAASVMNRLNEAAHDQTTTKLMKHKETEQKVEEQTSIEDNLFNEDEKCNVDETIHEQSVEEAKVDDETEHESVQKDEIQHVEPVTEDADSEEDVTVKEVVKMADHEVAPEMHQLCETFVAVDDQTTAKEDAPPSPLMNKENKNKETTQKVEEHATIEDENCNVGKKIDGQLIEAAKVDDQTENELVYKDEVKDFESVKEVENSEELAQEAKINNHKIEENMEEKENLTNLTKNHIMSDDNGTVKEDEKQALAGGETWDFKMMLWSVLISVWCIFHWYSDLPFPELSLVGSFLFILILLGYRNRAAYLVKYESK